MQELVLKLRQFFRRLFLENSKVILHAFKWVIDSLEVLDKVGHVRSSKLHLIFHVIFAQRLLNMAFELFDLIKLEVL